MPHASRATASWSADRRPRPIRRPIRSAMGMVTPKACGSSVTMIRTTSPPPTPLAIRRSATSISGGISRMKVNASRARKNGGMTSRMT